MNPEISHIRKHEVFVNLTEEELGAISNIITVRTLQEGEVVFNPSRRPRFLYYIKTGRLLLKLLNNEYKTLVPGQLFGEIGLLNTNFRSGTVSALEPTEVIQLCGTRLFNEEFVTPKTALKIVRVLSRRITNYLRTKEQISTKELIEQGENDLIEFKSTLRWNLHTDSKDKTIEKAILKTIAGFMNTTGGSLLVGVADDGKILGLDKDGFASYDKLLLHLTSIIKDRINAFHLMFLHFSIEPVNGIDILRIDCAPSTEPAYLQDGKLDHFYIRTGPATTDMRMSKVYEYVKERFYK